MSTLKELCEKHRIILTSSPAARTQWEDGTPRFTYQVRLQYGGQSYRTEFHMGVGRVKPIPANYCRGMQQRIREENWRDDPRAPEPPKAYEVLHDLLTKAQSVSGETFYDWCSNFDYSEDSRKAHIALRLMFSHDLRAELEEAAQNS